MVVTPTGRPHKMRFTIVALIACACVCTAVADVNHVKGVKGRLLGRLAGKAKHNKRGIFSGVPPYKLGHDIPLVTHSVVKPLVVTYPPTAAVAAVKIPVPHPHVPRYPVPVGHKVPGLPHPHYALNFPHTKFVAKPDHHYHHHHHHVSPRPVIPVVPATPVSHVAPVLPAPQPSLTVAHPVPAPPPLVHTAPVLHAQPLPVAAPPVPLIHQHQFNLRPLLPAPAVPIPQASLYNSASFPISQQFPYVIRPGGAVQSSLFATYPRYPYINSYQAPLYPIGNAATGVQSIQQVLLERPHVHQLQYVPQAFAHHGTAEQHTHQVGIEQTGVLHHPQPGVDLHTIQETIPQPGVHFHTGQEVIPQPGFQFHSTQEVVPQPGLHIHTGQEAQPQPGYHLHTTQEVLPQPGFHVHTGQEALAQPGLHLHPTQETVPQQGFHVHPTQEAVQQSGFHLHPTQETIQQPALQFHSTHVPQPIEPTQPSIQFDNNGWSPVASQHDQNIAHDGHYPQESHHFTQEQGTQVFEHHTNNQYDNQYHDYQHQLQHHIQQQIEQAQYEQSLNNQHQPSQEYGVPQQLGQDYGQPNEYSHQGQDFSQHLGQEVGQHGQDAHNDYNVAQLGQEYGVPHQGAEGRSAEDSGQQFHNHIPLKLQPPIDRPLDHFQ